MAKYFNPNFREQTLTLSTGFVSLPDLSFCQKNFHNFLAFAVVYRKPKLFGRSQRFLTFGFTFGCWRSMQPKTKGLAKGWNFWNLVKLIANFVPSILEWSNCMFVQCLKISFTLFLSRPFKSLCLNMPTKYLNTKYQTSGFTFNFEGRSFSTFTFGFGYGQK